MRETSQLIVSVDEYLNTDWVPRCEYIDGVLRPKALGTKPHGRMQVSLCNALAARGWDATPELTLRVGVSRFLVPDVAADPNPLASPYPDTPIALCIEILSPGDRLSGALAKCEEYHDWGVPHCWVINPIEPRAWIYDRGSGPVEIAVEGRLTAANLEIPLKELY